ncbi:MAG: hypothetical protein D3920_00845 [Candidatus Electrothrix sp. AW2]|nr:hypothetical protein [Candidatus Electrothrix gigas]
MKTRILRWRKRADKYENLRFARSHCYEYYSDDDYSTSMSSKFALCGFYDRPNSEDDCTEADYLLQKPFCWKCWLIYHFHILLDKASKPLPLGFYSGACFGVVALICLMAYLYESMILMAPTRPDFIFYQFMALTGQLAGYLVGGLVFIKMLSFIVKFYQGPSLHERLQRL